MSTAAWAKLAEHYQETKENHLRTYFKEDSNRGTSFSLVWNDFLLDYSKNRISQKTMSLLEDLARETGLEEAREA